MKIVNETHWQTAQLRAFVTRVALAELEPAKRKVVTIRFVHSRTRGPSGYATVNGTSCTVRVPRRDVNKPALAKVIAHEFAHLRGWEGGRSNELFMRGTARYGYRGNYQEYYAWTNDLPLDVQPPKPKNAIPPEQKDEKKIAGIQAALKRWESKKKRAETALKKYRRKLKYYEKKVAATRE